MFHSVINYENMFNAVLVLVAISVAMSVLFAFIYTLIKRKEGLYKDVAITLALLPIIITVVTVAITCLGDNYLGTAQEARYARVGIALVSVFVIMRFRSEQRKFDDLTYLFLSVGYGVLLGLGYLYLAILMYVLVVALMVVLHLLKLGELDEKQMYLTITVPEDLSYEHAFDEIFAKYTTFAKIDKVKLADMGTVYKISYNVILKNKEESKSFLDEIRTKNSNLNVSLIVARNGNNK